MALPPKAQTYCWDRGFESRRGHGCSCLLLCAVWVAASVTGWSLIQRSPSGCVWRSSPDQGYCTTEKKKFLWIFELYCSLSSVRTVKSDVRGVTWRNWEMRTRYRVWNHKTLEASLSIPCPPRSMFFSHLTFVVPSLSCWELSNCCGLQSTVRNCRIHQLINLAWCNATVLFHAVNIYIYIIFFPHPGETASPVGQDPHCRGFAITPIVHSVGLLWTSYRPAAETAHNSYNRQTSMPPAGFEPMFPASDRPQTQALDQAVRVSSMCVCMYVHSLVNPVSYVHMTPL